MNKGYFHWKVDKLILFYIFTKYFEPNYGYQPRVDSTVVKQYGLSSQNKRKFPDILFIEIQKVMFNLNYFLYATVIANYIERPKSNHI